MHKIACQKALALDLPHLCHQETIFQKSHPWSDLMLRCEPKSMLETYILGFSIISQMMVISICVSWLSGRIAGY